MNAFVRLAIRKGVRAVAPLPPVQTVLPPSTSAAATEGAPASAARKAASSAARSGTEAKARKAGKGTKRSVAIKPYRTGPFALDGLGKGIV